jgi:predicted dehydrogenase
MHLEHTVCVFYFAAHTQMLCLRHGKHVLVEKPMSLCAADTATMIDFARYCCGLGVFLLKK